MIGPAVAGSAGLGFGAAGITAESHPGRGPFDRPTVNPTNPAAKIADTINRGPTDLLITNLSPDVPSRRISSAARLSASRDRPDRPKRRPFRSCGPPHRSRAHPQPLIHSDALRLLHPSLP